MKRSLFFVFWVFISFLGCEKEPVGALKNQESYTSVKKIPTHLRFQGTFIAADGTVLKSESDTPMLLPEKLWATLTITEEQSLEKGNSSFKTLTFETSGGEFKPGQGFAGIGFLFGFFPIGEELYDIVFYASHPVQMQPVWNNTITVSALIADDENGSVLTSISKSSGDGGIMMTPLERFNDFQSSDGTIDLMATCIDAIPFIPGRVIVGKGVLKLIVHTVGE